MNTIYVSKENPREYIINPAPSDIENYYVAKLTDDEMPGQLEVYNPETGKFGPDPEAQALQANARRKVAYQQEADPMYMEWQYASAIGDTRADDYMLDWINKVNEIKSRYPKSST